MTKTTISIDQLVRSRRKSISLIVQADGSLLVKAPLHTPLRSIESLVQKKAVWIRSARERAKNRPQHTAHAFRDGEIFMFLGRAYPLEVVSDRADVVELAETLRLSERGTLAMRIRLLRWYQKQARAIFYQRVRFYSQQTGLVPTGVKLSNAARRWGSCGIHDNIYFSWRLVMAPVEIIDYVVVHELIHLRIKNHSQVFKQAVRVILPDAASREKWLKLNGGLLDF
jgi:predicted metal-dependent hydrolase